MSKGTLPDIPVIY